MTITDLAELPRALQDKLELELEPGEKILWTARPVASLLVRDVLFISVLTCLSAVFIVVVFWVFLAGLRNHEPGLFTLIVLAVVVPDIGIAVGLPLWMARKARRTFYAITDRRAMILTTGPTMAVRSFPSASLADIRKKERANGSGDILFAPLSRWRFMPIGFAGIRDVAQADQLLRQTVNGAEQQT